MAPSSTSTPTPGKPRLPAHPPPALLTPRLRNELNASLLHAGHIQRIHSQLLTNLHSTTFPSEIRALCLQLLREGEVTSYNELVEAVTARIVPAGKEKAGGVPNGVGSGKKAEGKGKDAAGLRVPKEVVDEGLVVVRECLADVVEID